ncbi:MAG TPA: glycosyltransferase family 39 protein [Candidatus Elarobacter sp.]|jgi:dolichyl-phosphate-mannose--protein O-mannosyl transferase|nr:glycosyltransferase family 39 protein [Candidatus Elarobacter sp.]
MSASARASGASFAAAGSAVRSSLAPLGVILGIGLILRLLFIMSTGFDNDVQAFESWTLTLRDNAPWLFYTKAGFADYPPGYFVVLWVLGRIYALIPGAAADPSHGYAILRVLIKLPAIAMDLVNAYVVYRIARRYASEKISLFAAALLALNPAAIYVSSYWGQVDSVSWGLILIALWMVLRAGDEPAKTVQRLAGAWVVLAFSVLIKPQGATLALLFLAYPFATSDAALRARRLVGTVYGVVASFIVAGVVGLLFHPAADVFGWLFGRYAFGSAVYKYTSVNAFNLYALRMPFWREDDQIISLFGVPLGTFALWGIALVLAATALIVGRYLQRRDDRALLEGAMLCALAFFVLATRMHERYVYGAFLLAMPLVAFGRSGIWSSLVLTVTMYLNLLYSFAYLIAMRDHVPNVDTADLWPLISHPAALANVVLFFWMGYLYLGGAEQPADAPAKEPWIERVVSAALAKARSWFDPREGIVAMDRRDWMFAGGFTLLAFLIAVANLAWPTEKIFDEVYFPRSAAEYLKHVPQYEWTHPPLVKLVIAASIGMFGDNSFGWRFLNVVAGAVEVGLLYVFAKRLFGSTLFAALAAFLLTMDGFHFAEQRIATGEITIAMLIVLVLYALYRFWLSSQVAVSVRVRREPLLVALGTLAAVPVAAAFSWLANLQPPVHRPDAMIANGIYNTPGPDATSYAVAFVYAMIGLYLLVRFLVNRFGTRTQTVTSYADGAYVRVLPGAKPATYVPPSDGGPVKRKMQPDGRYEYATPVATARFTPDGTMVVDERRTDARSAKVWLAVLVVALGLLISCKWNGFYDLALVFVVLTAVVAQRLFTSAAQWGNPRGFALDVVLGLCVFVPATIYALSYLPTFLLGTGHSLADIIALQHQMFWYHTSLSDHTHPYRSAWWQWPIMQIPIVYYYHDFRTGNIMNQSGAACCVAEIMALPNPLVFLLGLVSVPFTAWLAWQEKNKGYALLVLAYFMQWVPWMRSPRELFEYHFFPNLAVIVLCDVVLIAWLCRRYAASPNTMRVLAVYAAAVFAAFVFFYPVLAGTPISYDAWSARMLPDAWHIPHTSWIMPQRN